MFTKNFIITLVLTFVGLNVQAQNLPNEPKKPNEYEVAVYYFPSYHIDSTNEKWHGKNWSEWDLVKAAKPRFKGHEQPKVPTWGYFNE